MIILTDVGITGDDQIPVEVDETQIASIGPDPGRADDNRRLVTLQGGQWYFVAETLEQINELIAAAKGQG